MFKPERKQMAADFGRVPRLVSTAFPEEAQEDAIKMVRQVNGVNTYLSWAATGSPRVNEGVMYAIALAAIDTVTDYHQEEVHGPVKKAIGGEYEYRCLRTIPLALDAARSDNLEFSLKNVAEAQDDSLDQFNDLTKKELRKVTQEKGAHSAIGHLRAVKWSPEIGEEYLMSNFGFVMQLLDDYIDQPEDRREGISTLFTEGYMTGDDLERRRKGLIEEMRGKWDEPKAIDRFDKVTRWHKRLGDFVNRTGIPPSKIVPYYF